MRITLNIDDDVRMAIDRAARETGTSRSDIVNWLIRERLAARARTERRPHRSFPTHAAGVPRVNPDRIGEALETLDRS
ncbi:MAG TPA: CopG family transcriptional regulator [Miltoncostaeaceae bacterium]|nr:CopG family transcriptional regulator [Miltoncostaeaceae bacterium]